MNKRWYYHYIILRKAFWEVLSVRSHVCFLSLLREKLQSFDWCSQEHLSLFCSFSSRPQGSPRSWGSSIAKVQRFCVLLGTKLFHLHCYIFQRSWLSWSNAEVQVARFSLKPHPESIKKYLSLKFSSFLGSCIVGLSHAKDKFVNALWINSNRSVINDSVKGFMVQLWKRWASIFSF